MNGFGMGPTPVGSLDAYATTPGGGTPVAPASDTTEPAANERNAPAPDGTGPGLPAPTAPGFDPMRNLRPRGLGNSRSLLIGPGMNAPPP